MEPCPFEKSIESQSHFPLCFHKIKIDIDDENRWNPLSQDFTGAVILCKLEDEVQIEFRCMHSAYENIRPCTDEEQNQMLDAWKKGQTGYPLVDTCIRSLRHTGWLNFPNASYDCFLCLLQPMARLARD